MKNKEFTDFEKLRKDMFQHVKKNAGIKLLCLDNPMLLDIGWLDTVSNTRWSIKISDFKEKAKEMELQAIRTSKGKLELGKVLESHANKALLND